MHLHKIRIQYEKQNTVLLPLFQIELKKSSKLNANKQNKKLIKSVKRLKKS